jgi:hypothetical protein
MRLLHRASPAALGLGVVLLAGCGGARRSFAPGCDALEFDLRAGLLNGLPPTASMNEVRRQLPCATGDTEEGHPFNEGGGVFFLTHDLYFYTHRDRIEVREAFDGRVVPALLGGRYEAVVAVFGPATRGLPDGGGKLTLHPTRYGCLGVTSVEGRVVQVQAHARPCEVVELG